MVYVLMVGIVDMPMHMEHRLVDVVMAVAFREMSHTPTPVKNAASQNMPDGDS